MTLGWAVLGWIAVAPVTESVVPFVTGVVDHSAHVLTAPVRMSGKDWVLAAAAVGSVGVVAAFDRQLLEAAQSDGLLPLGTVSRVAEPLGRGAANLAIVPFFLYGILADDASATAVAVDLAATSLVSTVLITPGLKMAVGRSRPKNEEGTYHFEPFTWRSSFPSADAARAFGLVSVLTEHYSSPWFQVPAYTAAGLVAYGRVRRNAHFPSDVLAGALIGFAVGKSAARYNPSEKLRISVLPGEVRQILLVWDLQ